MNNIFGRFSGSITSCAIGPVLGLAVCMSIATSARAADMGRYDRNIERAAAQIAAKKLGELRGGFSHDVNVDMVTITASTEKPEEASGQYLLRAVPSAQDQLPAGDEPQRVMQRENALPPIVLDNNGWSDLGVDPVMTGGTGQPTWLSAGEVEFKPPAAPPLSR
ncbi:MAG: hypothetical protein R3D32_08420 [Nitratireductor sp.]